MREQLDRALRWLQQTLKTFTPGQRAIAGIGVAALLLAGFMVFRWASTPSYSPLYTNLASSDASAVIDQLNAKGVPYQISDGGSTIMVPKKDVYSTRITLSGEGIPSNSGDDGYSILDNEGLSTSDFQQQTDYKRAMEAELSKTIEAINGVQTAVVHLAIPQQQVFSSQQQSPTASVLVQTRAGQTLASQQVQAVINLVASSINGLTPENVTVADSTGQVLSVGGGTSTAASGVQTQDVVDFQTRMGSAVQQQLDRVLGPGNSNVQVTADLDFDKVDTQQIRYFYDPKAPALSAASTNEKYNGVGGVGGTSGVVGPDGQMDPGAGVTTTGTAGKYHKVTKSSDNAVDRTVEQRQAAPGSVRSLHVGVVVDTLSAGSIAPSQLRNLIGATLGINTKRGDTVNVSTMPFNRAPEKQAAAELAAANTATATAHRNTLIRNGCLVLVLFLVLLLAWLRGRKRSKLRQDATTYVVEQLRRDASDRAATQALEIPNPAMIALESTDQDLTREAREEIAALVERQPEDVAALLRGWLVDRVGP